MRVSLFLSSQLLLRNHSFSLITILTRMQSDGVIREQEEKEEEKEEEEKGEEEEEEEQPVEGEGGRREHAEEAR